MIEIAGIDIPGQYQSDGLPEKAAVDHQLVFPPILRRGGAVQKTRSKVPPLMVTLPPFFAPDGLQPTGEDEVFGSPLGLATCVCTSPPLKIAVPETLTAHFVYRSSRRDTEFDHAASMTRGTFINIDELDKGIPD